jgi:translation initiation factor eIF-2B subunit delta
MIIGSNTVIEETLLRAARPPEKDKVAATFNVIVVDTCPNFLGREVAKRLSHHGIACKYTLIQGISALINQTTKVFLGVSYVLGNGGVVGDIGTSMVAYYASQHKVPVIAFCETYKFT